MKKVLSRITVGVVALTLLAGCGSGPASSPAGVTAGDKPAGAAAKPKIAVVLKAVNSDYWNIVKAGALDAAKKLDADVSVLGPNEETDVTGQVSMLEDHVVKKVSALVVAPSQPSAATPVFDKAKAANIPVLLVDTNAAWDGKATFIGTGNEAGGKLGGEFIVKRLQKGDQVAIIRGQQGDPTHDQRQKGAEDAMKAAGLNVVAIQPANSARDLGASVMENILQAHKEIKAVFCTNDEMCLGAVRSIQARKATTITVGFDGSPDALKSIKEGGLTASVAQSPYNMGYKGVELALKAIKGEKLDPVVDTGTSVIESSNVDKAQADLKQILGK